MKRPVADIVVLLPGITGSVLQRGDRDVFALSAGAGWRALTSRGKSLSELILGEDPVDVDDLGDHVRATRLAPDATLVPGLWKIDGYGKVAATLRREFDLVPGENYFEFPYDWRRDNRVHARRLQRESAEWLRRRREQAPGARLVLIAHSMGGLVARYFLEVLGGWRDTRALVTFGTPYRGSVKALNALVNGMPKLPFLELTEVVRSCTSVYQLLPIYPCLDTGDGELHRLQDVTLDHLDAERVRAADAFHREIERAVEANRRDDDYQRDGYLIRPIVGVEQPTLQSAVLRAGGLEMLRTWNGEALDGDGTVPAVSAVPIELSDLKQEFPAATAHASLQNADHVLRFVRTLLTEARQYRFRAGAPVTVSLDVDDVYLAGEPVVLHAQLSDRSRPAVGVIQSADDGTPIASTPIPASDADWREITFGALVPGVYRFVVAGGDDVQPASDLFAVMSG
ncbi:hypothetical protein OJ997_04565 [Solirubrobacter phytolaccae]|uniref:Lecithin:cholesterol acyltransferase n=1 Tax=Solirubrobacter phytolaccae TaxID=1404360 RepID=A0A9X3N4G0_9ACTN|nr:hypothetical protein [Solirubrobacter phytolaccae]MDA0179558.1 hypothetical protein [Solirubrobacter phytolaccae]